MYYEFYYKIKNGKEHILYISYDEEGNKDSDIIGSTKKLIEFIKHNCLEYCEVSFIDFDSNMINYILSEIIDTIEIIYPPIGEEGPYQMFKRQVKVRGK